MRMYRTKWTRSIFKNSPFSPPSLLNMLRATCSNINLLTVGYHYDGGPTIPWSLPGYYNLSEMERERGQQMVSGGGDDDEDEKWIISWELPAVAWLAPNRWWILSNLFWSIYGRTDKSRDNVIAEALQLCQKFFTDIWSIFQEQTGEGHWGNVLRDFK